LWSRDDERSGAVLFGSASDEYAVKNRLLDVTEDAVLHYGASTVPLDSDICGPAQLPNRLLRCLLAAYWPHTLVSGGEANPAQRRLGSALGDIYNTHSGVVGPGGVLSAGNVAGSNICSAGGARTSVAGAAGGSGGVHAISMDDFISPAPSRAGRLRFGDVTRGAATNADYGEYDADGDDDTVGLQRDEDAGEYGAQADAVERRLRGEYGGEEAAERRRRERRDGMNGMVVEGEENALLLSNTSASEHVTVEYSSLLVKAYVLNRDKGNVDAYGAVGIKNAHVMYKVSEMTTLFALSERLKRLMVAHGRALANNTHVDTTTQDLAIALRNRSLPHAPTPSNDVAANIAPSRAIPASSAGLDRYGAESVPFIPVARHSGAASGGMAIGTGKASGSLTRVRAVAGGAGIAVSAPARASGLSIGTRKGHDGKVRVLRCFVFFHDQFSFMISSCL